MQTLADVHDTPSSWLPSAPAGVGTGWIVHVVPSQLSAKLDGAPGLL